MIVRTPMWTSLEQSQIDFGQFFDLLRSGKLAGIKIGQVWLIEKDAFAAYLEKRIQSEDGRFMAK